MCACSARAPPPPSIPRRTCTAHPAIGGRCSRNSSSARCGPPGRAQPRRRRDRSRGDGQRSHIQRRRRAPPAPVGLPAAHARTDGHARRLRARSVRRMHDPPRWRCCPFLPPTGGAGRGLHDRDRGGARRKRGAAPAAGGFSRASRPAVRVLHLGDPDGGGEPARAERDSHTGRDRRHALGTPLPMHGLRADRRRDRTGGGRLVNLALSLAYAAERHPEHEALVDGDVRLTYAALRERAARLARGLESLGLARGDRLAAVLTNRHETVELYWASQWLGAVFVPLSWRASRGEVDYCIEDAAAEVVWTEQDGSVRAGDTTFRELLETDEHPGALDTDELADSLMLYTSGTTGKPKGVPRSHRADRAGGLSQVVQHGLEDGDRTLGAMPLYHTMGMHSLLAMSLIGGCFVLQRRWDAREALDLIEREQLTTLYLAPTLFHDLVETSRGGERDLSSVRGLAYAGAAMTSKLV